MPLDIANYCALQIDREGASRTADQPAFSPTRASGRAATWETVEAVRVRSRPRKRIEVGRFGIGKRSRRNDGCQGMASQVWSENPTAMWPRQHDIR